jgi:hypothetical protein
MTSLSSNAVVTFSNAAFTARTHVSLGAGSVWLINNDIGLRLYIGSCFVNISTTQGWTKSNALGTPISTRWHTTIGNYVEFTGVQLEKGTIATPFEFRPYAIELRSRVVRT